MKQKKTQKTALITGITGQDGSYLADFLLAKNYKVHGMIRRSSTINNWRIEHLFLDEKIYDSQLFLHYGDVTDAISLQNLIKKICPDEIYNLAAQSHVKISFEIPEITAQIDAISTLKILEIVRSLGSKTKIYQASTSELYGKQTSQEAQNEKTDFHPYSPYAIAKLYSYWIIKNYREAYSLFACNGILFNHESERRGFNFVSRKITIGLSKVALGLKDSLVLGNLDSKRDWGYAPEYVEAMWLMLQQEKAEDFVIATGETHTVREFIEVCCKWLNIDLEWQGKGINEIGIDKSKKKTIIKIDSKYFRPTEVAFLLGDPSKAEKELGWKAKTKFHTLAAKLIRHDYDLIQKNKGRILY